MRPWLGGPGDDLYRFDPDIKEGNVTVIENSGPGSGTDTLDFSQAATGIKVDLSATDISSRSIRQGTWPDALLGRLDRGGHRRLGGRLDHRQ